MTLALAIATIGTGNAGIMILALFSIPADAFCFILAAVVAEVWIRSK